MYTCIYLYQWKNKSSAKLSITSNSKKMTSFRKFHNSLKTLSIPSPLSLLPGKTLILPAINLYKPSVNLPPISPTMPSTPTVHSFKGSKSFYYTIHHLYFYWETHTTTNTNTTLSGPSEISSGCPIDPMRKRTVVMQGGDVWLGYARCC